MSHFHRAPQASPASGTALLDSGFGVLSSCFLLIEGKKRQNKLLLDTSLPQVCNILSAAETLDVECPVTSGEDKSPFLLLAAMKGITCACTQRENAEVREGKKCAV